MMNKSAVFGMLVVITMIASSSSWARVQKVSTPMPCMYSEKGVDFDLSPLYRTAAGTDWLGYDTTSIYVYGMNVCGHSTDARCKGMACQYHQGSGEVIAIMTRDESPYPSFSLIDGGDATKGIRQTYTNGQDCWMAIPTQRTVNILYVCDPTSIANLTIVEDPVCTYTYTLRTVYACPTSSGVITSCVHSIPDKRLKWDLTSLRSSKDYAMIVHGVTYTMSFCGTSTRGGVCTNFNNSACIYGESGAFQSGLGGLAILPFGSWSLINYARPEIGIEQHWANGDSCVTTNGTKVASSLVTRIYCQRDGRPDVFDVAADRQTCTWTYTFTVPQGCPATV